MEEGDALEQGVAAGDLHVVGHEVHVGHRGAKGEVLLNGPRRVDLIDEGFDGQRLIAEAVERDEGGRRVVLDRGGADGGG